MTYLVGGVLALLYCGTLVAVVYMVLKSILSLRPQSEIPQPGRTPRDDTVEDLIAAEVDEDYANFTRVDPPDPEEPKIRRRPNRRRKAQRVRLEKQKARSSTWHDRILQEDD